MADLLTAAERAEILSAIQDVTDTFMKIPVILKQRRDKLITAFNENRDDNSNTYEIELLGLFVPEKTDTDAEAMLDTSGALDASQGDVYFNYQDLLNLESPSLINNAGQVDIVPNKDTIVIKDEERDIIAVDLVGPNEDIFYLVKLIIKNRIGPDKPLTDD